MVKSDEAEPELWIYKYEGSAGRWASQDTERNRATEGHRLETEERRCQQNFGTNVDEPYSTRSKPSSHTTRTHLYPTRHQSYNHIKFVALVIFEWNRVTLWSGHMLCDTFFAPMHTAFREVN